jgi:hypothetical protein
MRFWGKGARMFGDDLRKKSITLFLIWLLVGLGSFCLWYFVPMAKRYIDNKRIARVEPVPWMTIFVHGSFGSLLGFLNMTDVLHDKISGTLYRKVIKGMRNDEHFFKDQAILQRGLIPLEPTFDIQSVGNKKHSVYPLAMAYELVTQAVRPGKEKNYFYTFGWSGLISQNSRRFEAIRFYNALTEELDRLKSLGIEPKIRLLCHSHGGNLALNLAAISLLLSAGVSDERKILSQDPDENESLQKMLATIKELTTKEDAKTKTDQKIYDYVPMRSSIIIDELIMFGTPIQPETEAFCYSHVFKKVYNFYSDQDYVQRADWVSSKQSLSSQRLVRYPVLTQGKHNIVVQARIMADKQVHKGKIVLPVERVESVSDQKSASKKQEKEPTILDELFGGRNIFSRESKDPTHKELWFVSWRDEMNSAIHPFPMAILAPLMTKAIDKRPDQTDVDINIKDNFKKVIIQVAAHKQALISSTASISRLLIKGMQSKMNAWKPSDDSMQDEFNAVYKHLS